jgi:hypothetical protein
MYANTAAVSRPEITAFLEEARDLEKQFIAEKVSPIHTVGSRAGRYPRIRIAKGELMKRDSTRRGPSGTYNEVSQKYEWDTYDCEDRGLAERIDDANSLEMDKFFDMEVTTAKLVKRKMMIDQEIRVAEMLMNPSNFNSTAAKVNYTNTLIATIDFPFDLQAAQARLEAKAVIPNTLIITRALWDQIRRSTLLQTFLFNNLNTAGSRLITTSHIKDGFGIENIYIATPNYDQANKAKAAALTPIWTPNYIWLGKVEGGDFQNGGATRTLVWGADCPGGLYITETWRDEERRGDMVRVRTHTSEKVIDETCAELIATNYSAA